MNLNTRHHIILLLAAASTANVAIAGACAWYGNFLGAGINLFAAYWLMRTAHLRCQALSPRDRELAGLDPQ